MKGVGSDCETTSYGGDILKYDDDEELVAESDYMTSTSWFVNELNTSTKYELDVISYGSSCDEYSEPASAKFTTTGTNGVDDPASPTKRDLSPLSRVRNLVIDTTTTSGKITISWDKPADIGNKRNKKCAYTTDAADHADVAILYSYYITNLTSDVEFYSNDIRNYTDVSITLDLPDTVKCGDMLEVGVSAYSELCDSWSNVTTSEATHNT